MKESWWYVYFDSWVALNDARKNSIFSATLVCIALEYWVEGFKVSFLVYVGKKSVLYTIVTIK
jgi:hypothetical protein